MTQRFDGELDSSPEDEIGFFSFLGIYLASLSAIVLASWAAHRHFDWPMLRTLMGLAAVQFLAGSIRWPRWNWRMLRPAGWFATRPGPLLQVLFVLFAAFCVLVAILVPEFPGPAV